MIVITPQPGRGGYRRFGALLAVMALLLAACGSTSDSARPRDRRKSAAPGTTKTWPVRTASTAAPNSIAVPPPAPPPPPTAPPPPVTVRPPKRPPVEDNSPTTNVSPTTNDSSPPHHASASSTPAPTTTKPTAEQATIKTVVYSLPGAPKRSGDLVFPANHADVIILLVHEGNEGAGRRVMRGWANFYANRGYASFAIDYFAVKADATAPIYPRPERDVKRAVQYFRDHADQLGIDPDRIVVYGFSGGARTGAQAYVTADERFFAGAGGYAGISDRIAGFIGFHGTYDGTHSNPNHYYGGGRTSTDPNIRDRYQRADSIAHASEASGPSLLFQGARDKPQLVMQAKRFHGALVAAGKNSTLAIVPDVAQAFDHAAATGELTPAGQRSAQQVLVWLRGHFPTTVSAAGSR